MQGKDIATIIIQQLGGYGKLKAMINARNMAYDDNSLSFRFSGYRKAVFCRITLTSLDLYHMRLFKVDKYGTIKTAFELGGMYNDMLIPVFESATGLRLSL